MNEAPDRASAGLNELAADIHLNAVEHGWWDEERTLPEILMLCVSELAEALEEYRSGNPMVWHKCGERLLGDTCEHGRAVCAVKSPQECEAYTGKPEGIAVELADCLIRILDYCGREGIDIEHIVRMKHEYNKRRPYRHGGKVC